jgi:hypothetical protein
MKCWQERIGGIGLLCIGVAAGVAICVAIMHEPANTLAQSGSSKKPTLESVSADVEDLKAKETDQSHVMMDVAFQFSNVWTAGEHDNWPLAEFFLGEGEEHIEWAVRLEPVRKDSAGRLVQLKDILQAVQNSPLKQLKAAVKAKDKPAFEKAYRFMLEGCYSCHKAVSKPYLHPQLPTGAATPILNFDPNATWPK